MHFSLRWSLSNCENRNWMPCCNLPAAVWVSTGWVTATTEMPMRPNSSTIPMAEEPVREKRSWEYTIM
ncbi:hypothetical protein K0O23_12245 [Pontibacter aydingkolensis]|uniref:Uncharacterized protein n=1 Tax=Pontibacter aydingkolensis TaxID=1911536 RepID=A0ABS7CVE6_9BACT|nr:hypothetical protein [Pontibacter aydingkolensis]MBW7467838.1 hypothetical protein [Pontibacter aydingkolensis]